MEQQNLAFLQFEKGTHIFMYVHVYVKANEKCNFNSIPPPYLTQVTFFLWQMHRHN